MAERGNIERRQDRTYCRKNIIESLHHPALIISCYVLPRDVYDLQTPPER